MQVISRGVFPSTAKFPAHGVTVVKDAEPKRTAMRIAPGNRTVAATRGWVRMLRKLSARRLPGRSANHATPSVMQTIAASGIAFRAEICAPFDIDRAECNKAAVREKLPDVRRSRAWTRAPEIGADQRLGAMDVALLNLDLDRVITDSSHAAVDTQRLAQCRNQRQRPESAPTRANAGRSIKAIGSRSRPVPGTPAKPGSPPASETAIPSDDPNAANINGDADSHRHAPASR